MPSIYMSRGEMDARGDSCTIDQSLKFSARSLIGRQVSDETGFRDLFAELLLALCRSSSRFSVKHRKENHEAC